MPAPAALAEPSPLAAQRAEDREHYRAILRRVIDAGIAIVEALDPAFTDPATVAAAYPDVARAIRQGILLADKLAEPIPEPREPAPIVRTPQPAAAPARSEPVEPLERERQERIERLDPLPDRSTEDIILAIRRALGLLPTPSLRRTLPAFEPRAALAAFDHRDDAPQPPADPLPSYDRIDTS